MIFSAADDAGLDALGRALHLVQHAVDAVADPQVVLGRLDVDVRGAVGDRLRDEQVHEPDDRRVVVDDLADLATGRPRPRVGVLERLRQVFELVVGAAVPVDGASRSSCVATTGVTCMPVIDRTSSTAKTFAGSAMATSSSTVLERDRQHRSAGGRARRARRPTAVPVDGVVVEVDELPCRPGRRGP